MLCQQIKQGHNNVLLSTYAEVMKGEGIECKGEKWGEGVQECRITATIRTVGSYTVRWPKVKGKASILFFHIFAGNRTQSVSWYDLLYPHVSPSVWIPAQHGHRLHLVNRPESYLSMFCSCFCSWWWADRIGFSLKFSQRLHRLILTKSACSTISSESVSYYPELKGDVTGNLPQAAVNDTIWLICYLWTCNLFTPNPKRNTSFIYSFIRLLPLGHWIGLWAGGGS